MAIIERVDFTVSGVSSAMMMTVRIAMATA